MTNKGKLNPLPFQDLQNAFETALDEIQQAQPPSHRTPIFRREMTTVAQSEKRAVSDAASALARLWKVGPHPAR